MTNINPTELPGLNIRRIQGVAVGLGEADPLIDVSAKLELQYPGHLILVQAGAFLHGYNRTAYVLHVLKKYQLKLGGTTKAPHLRAGFRLANFKQRLWPMVEEFNIPYVVALGSQQNSYELYISTGHKPDDSVLSTVSDEIVHQVIEDLQSQKQLNKSSTEKMLANPDTSEFIFKTKAQDLDYQLLQDLLKLPRDVRTTWGENVRECMVRILRGTYLYGNEDNKPRLLKQISADIDLLKHYITQAQRLNRFKIAFEHRVGLAVELGRIVGGLMRSHKVQP
jgi:hypothetical protein